MAPLREHRFSVRSGWLVGAIALVGGLVAAVSLHVAGSSPTTGPGADPLADPIAYVSVPHATASDEAISQQLTQALARPDIDSDVAAFYAERGTSPLWFDRGRPTPEARRLVAQVTDAQADGLNPADYRVDDLRDTVRTAARSGKADDLARAEFALTMTLASWAADLHRPKPAAALLYSDQQLRPPSLSRREALDVVAKAPSLKVGIAQVTRMNPIYSGLHAALARELEQGGANAAVIRANLERARALPTDLGKRFVLVDIAAQRLWMYEDGRPVDSMKVVVGKPSDPTPQMAALLRYAVFRPYWNVPPDLVAHRMAPKVMKQGLGYFRSQNLQALSSWDDAKAKPMSPSRVNWKAVASGKQTLRVRQMPGPDNMMGQVKFMFPNNKGVYLHDSPLRALFTGEERFNSAGCVRLEDASRLGRWLLGDDVVMAGEGPGPPETRANLREPVPVYLAYFTAAPTAEGVNLRKDVYDRDAALIARLEQPAGGEQLASR
jgi:murein L,D-transpeptidase YcbB/YkuD